MWAPDPEGRGSGDLAAVGTTAYTAVIVIVNLKVRRHILRRRAVRDWYDTPRVFAAAVRAVGMLPSCALASIGKASRPACRRLR